ncbi:MAG: alginate export family protein [Deltaproteobacteria bacterium]|nr:alginate export family protein [Deltaproteobacteria bacterium]
MKRILLSVFAVAITAAWALPTTATASEVTLGGQYRLRGEQRNNADFNDSVNDHTDFWGQRVRLTANAKATDDTSVKITLQDTRNWGTVNTVANTGVAGSLTDTGNTLDLHESYVNLDKLFGAPVSLRAGRQELSYGDERLVGSLGWSNNGRSFDALKLVATTELVNVDLFTAKTNDTNVTAKDQDFHGLYVTVKAVPNNTVDLYVLSLRDNAGAAALVTNNTTNATITGTGGFSKTQVLNTYGLRVKGGLMGIDYTAEFANQTGSMQTEKLATSTTTRYKIGARAYAIKGGYTLTAPVKIRVGAEYDYASGDKDSTDNKIGTFSNLFPTHHAHLGYMDMQNWRNVKALSLNVKADVTSELSLYAAYWNFKLAQKKDAWYTGGANNATQTGTLRAANANNTNSDIGSEYDLVANYKYNSAVNVELGYGQFKAGKFAKDNINGIAATGTTSAGKSGNSTWTYLQLTANF